MRKVAFLILSTLILYSCTAKKYSIIEVGNTKVIVGEFPIEILQTDDFKWFNEGYSKFTIEEEEDFKMIKSKANKFDVLIFLGTWCPDSREYVPKFMKIIDEAGISRKHIKMIGLNRDKVLKGLTDKYDIKRVPTFIFFQNGKEIGRIVEHPHVSLTKNIAKIVEQIE
jgi:thiol-disulfide isomerase/thioredoxin